MSRSVVVKKKTRCPKLEGVGEKRREKNMTIQ